MKFQSAALISVLAASALATPLVPRNASEPVKDKKNGGKGAGVKTNGTAGVVLPDGRIAKTAKKEDFDVLESVFKSAVVKGDGLKFSDLIEFPDVPQSLFDKAGDTKAFEITIDDKSIFIPKGGAADSTTRRADLLPSIRSTLNDVATTGQKTMHFSFTQSATNPLNLDHGYQVAFLETADFQVHQFDVVVGKPASIKPGEPGADGKSILVRSNSRVAAEIKTLFSTPFVDGWHNFAVSMDFEKNTVQIFYSIDEAPLKQVTEPLDNDLKGNGEYHFAVLKSAAAGVQPPIAGKEGVVFGGIFMEDTSSAPVTLQ